LPATPSMRSRLPVFLTGITSFLLYLFLTRLSSKFNWGEGYSERPILTYLAIYFSLFALYGLTWFFVRKHPGDRGIFWTVIVFGLLFRVAILPSQQIQEDDIYRYLWDGKVFANGINPFEYAPTEVHDFKALRIQNPEKYYETYVERNEQELERLDELKWKSPQSVKILERVNHPDVPTIYPPMAQFVFRLVHHIKPDSIVAMRAGFFVFDIMALVFIIGILSRLGMDKAGVMVYFWSPLIIKETFNSTHLDIIGISLLCGSIYFLVCHRHTLATLFLAFSFLGKLYPIILLPLYLQACYEKSMIDGKKAWRVLFGNSALFMGIIILGYLPFMGIGLDMFEGLKAFTLFWQSNDSIFAVLVFIFTLISDGSEIILSNPLPVFLSKVTVASILIGVVFRLLLKRVSLLQQPIGFVRGFFWIMALVFLLSPVQNPWYLCWVVPFLCIFPHRSLIFLTGLVGFYYLDFYFDYQELQGYSQWIPWVEYLPFYFLLALEFWRNRNQKHLKEGHSTKNQI
jgi:alpha-1,6-mannosyltransferase